MATVCTLVDNLVIPCSPQPPLRGMKGKAYVPYTAYIPLRETQHSLPRGYCCYIYIITDTIQNVLQSQFC